MEQTGESLSVCLVPANVDEGVLTPDTRCDACRVLEGSCVLEQVPRAQRAPRLREAECPRSCDQSAHGCSRIVESHIPREVEPITRQRSSDSRTQRDERHSSRRASIKVNARVRNRIT